MTAAASHPAPPASAPEPGVGAPAALPTARVWQAAAIAHRDLFEPLLPGARIGLIDRRAPTQMLVWTAGPTGIEASLEPFGGYAASAADIVLAADELALAAIAGAAVERLFEVLRAGIRCGDLVCYTLRRRCVLEERGFEEMLDALGYAFMGACR